MIKEKLLEVRLKKGLSQEELADLVGMSQPNYSRRENGLKKISDSEWELIAKKLEVKKEDILEEDSKESINKSKGDSSVNSLGNMHCFNVPDFVLEHIEFLKNQNKELKEENEILKRNKQFD